SIPKTVMTLLKLRFNEKVKLEIATNNEVRIFSINITSGAEIKNKKVTDYLKRKSSDLITVTISKNLARLT
ncbi:MAG TPA: hypothetical protein VFR02_10605, partial [bacterium]|nr:hypothetical protein [bacterium]